ncbi:MAG: tetrathionate reductase family octaheme c-type cytochrome [Caldimicrobium sp.]
MSKIKLTKFAKVFFLSLPLLGVSAFKAEAAFDHSQVIRGNFTRGQEVTAQCIKCHEKEAVDFMKTSHWKWMGPPNHIGKFQNPANAKKEWGKINMFNNFCVNPWGGNFEFCGKCHAGYLDNYAKCLECDPVNIDCLVCHTQEKSYFKGKKPGGKVDPEILNKAATQIGKPQRFNCGFCHFAGGGGDNVKHGGLYTKMGGKIPREIDVHMGGADMTCQDCHVTKNHQIAGASTMLATYSARVSCTDCHDEKTVHANSPAGKMIAKHLKTVACETCHIPAIARGGIATKLHWDWSYVGKEMKELEGKEEFGREVYAKHKGVFKWGVNVIPTYMWYNGKVERYLLGDKLDPNTVLDLNKPMGSIKDPKAKIYPFKVHTGKQPYDVKYKYLLPFRVWKSLWSDYNWQKAIELSAKEMGLPYSGNFDFVSTAYYISVRHEVAPKEMALTCNDCHFKRRLDWKALGYPDDPALVGGRFTRGIVKVKKSK